MIKLIDIKPSQNPQKKYTATFFVSGVFKKVNFGAAGYNDFTLTATKQQRDNYWKRHWDEQFQNVTSPGMLSLYILWGNSNDININIENYRQKFNL